MSKEITKFSFDNDDFAKYNIKLVTNFVRQIEIGTNTHGDIRGKKYIFSGSYWPQTLKVILLVKSEKLVRSCKSNDWNETNHNNSGLKQIKQI